MTDLNRRVAEALGKRVVTVASADDWHYVDEQNGVVAYVPLPDWAHDLNAAVTLPLPPGHWLELSVFPDGGSNASIHGPNTRYYDEYASGAAAICEAWLLAWKGQGDG